MAQFELWAHVFFLAPLPLGLLSGGLLSEAWDRPIVP